MSLNYTEIIGYLAMAFVAISFTFKNVRSLRFFNFIGASFFVIYGILISAWPVAIVNGFIAIINVYHLFIGSSRS
ncbi:hypothetical protein [Persicobacter psychrovividus]|uniref:Uroporphyrinogen decarboxylase n=1 Tax=Persicobacter psychrovividus TaxID=387638 RepID=A0ABM7VB55_9BACT|nr:uroporphyrinogen decarboxylase [Persicobacter psychrovividus]